MVMIEEGEPNDDLCAEREFSFQQGYCPSDDKNGDHHHSILGQPQLSQSPLLQQPKLYKRRWFILLLFSINGLICSMIQMTYAAILDIVLKYYKFNSTETWKVNLMSLCYLVAYLPTSFVASSVIQKRGLRFSVTLGALMNFLSSWIRMMSGFHKSNDTQLAHTLYWISFGGQCMGAIGQPFLVTAITQFSVNWFGEKERSLATAIASFLNILGSAVSFGLAPLIAGNGTEIGMTVYLFIQALFCSITLILTVIFFKDRPPSPPSWSEFEKQQSKRRLVLEGNHDQMLSTEAPTIVTATTTTMGPEMKSETTIFKSYLSVLTNVNFVILMIAFAMGFAVFMSFTTLINQIIIPRGYDNNDAGLFGTLVIASGLLGALVYSVLADVTKRYKLLLSLCGLVALGSFAWFCVVIMFNKTHGNYVMCCVSIAIMGMHATSVVPLALELAVEMTFPRPESLANGLLYGCGTLLSVVCLVVMNSMQVTKPDEDHPERRVLVSMQNALWLALSIFSLAVLLIFLFRPKYKRLEHEKQLKQNT